MAEIKAARFELVFCFQNISALAFGFPQQAPYLFLDTPPLDWNGSLLAAYASRSGAFLAGLRRHINRADQRSKIKIPQSIDGDLPPAFVTKATDPCLLIRPERSFHACFTDGLCQALLIISHEYLTPVHDVPIEGTPLLALQCGTSSLGYKPRSDRLG